MKMNNNRWSCLFTCAMTLTLQSCAKASSDDDPMNVLFLLIDDVRWDSLHCMGSDYMITPNIDKLAEDGVIFDNAYVTSGISCVSRASILTGQHMSRHHINRFGLEITPENFANTYPAQLRNAGYWSGIVGKYGVGVVRSEDYDYSTVYDYIHWYPTDPNGKIKRLKDGYTRIEGDSIHVTRRNVKDAFDFLDKAPKDKPFCLNVGFYAAHAEDLHPEQYRYQPSSQKYYEDVTIPLPESADDKYLERLPFFLQDPTNEGRVRWFWRYDTPEKYQHMMKSYFRLITEVDIAVGEIVARLKADGVYDNTLIVFMGDNGYFHSEHQLADKWYPYNEAMRVPMIIHDPRLEKSKRGQRVQELVLNIDVPTTMLKAAGQTPPETMQGCDLADLYLRGTKEWRTDFYYEHPIINSIDCIPNSEALVSLKEKYINWPYYSVEEYFDLESDPLELNNKIDDSESKTVIDVAKTRFETLKMKAK